MNKRLYVIGNSPKLVAHVIRGLKDRGEAREGEDGNPYGLEEEADVYVVISGESDFQAAQYLFGQSRSGATIAIDATRGSGFAKRLTPSSRRSRSVFSSINAFDQHLATFSADKAA